MSSFIPGKYSHRQNTLKAATGGTAGANARGGMQQVLLHLFSRCRVSAGEPAAAAAVK